MFWSRYCVMAVSVIGSVASMNVPTLVQRQSSDPVGNTTTAITVIGNLGKLGLLHQNLTFSTQALSLYDYGDCDRYLPTAEAIIGEFNFSTNIQLAAEAAPQSQTPFSEVEQYAILAASYNSIVLIKGFLNAMILKKRFFLPYATDVIQVLQTNLGVYNVFLEEVKAFAPTVADTIDGNELSLIRFTNYTIAALECGY